jgi:hypothetical protein
VHRFSQSIPQCDFVSAFSERIVTNKTLVLGLLLACLANLICLVGYL